MPTHEILGGKVKVYRKPESALARLQLHDYVLFMTKTGLRPDEVNRPEHGDVEFVEERNHFVD